MSELGTNQIARKIHDGIAQDLVALGYSLDQALGAPELPLSTRAELRSLRFNVSDLITKVRREIFDLRANPISLEEQTKLICGELTGIIEIETEPNSTLYPIAIELLRNAVTHSGASLINLRTFQRNAFTVIEVSDNGKGRVEMKSDRFGFIGIAEVIAELAGKIEFIELAPGLTVRVSIPN